MAKPTKAVAKPIKQKKNLVLNVVAKKPVLKKPKKEAPKKEKRDPKAPSAFIVIRNAPFGFFEEACYSYFSQYGKVIRVRVVRNKKGGFSGKIYVGFKYPEVAAIVVTVLNKSLMMGEHVVKCRQLLNGEVPPAVQYGTRYGKRQITKTTYLKKRITSAHLKKYKENPENVAQFLHKQLAKAKENGIDYTFDFSKKYSQALKDQKVRDEAKAENIKKWLKNFD